MPARLEHTITLCVLIDRADRIRFHAAHLLIPTHRIATPFLPSVIGMRLVVVMRVAQQAGAIGTSLMNVGFPHFALVNDTTSRPLRQPRSRWRNARVDNP